MQKSITHPGGLFPFLIAFAPSALAQSSGSADAAAMAFTDVTAQTNAALPNQLTESVAWGDYDNDGEEDLYLTNNGPNALFQNNGNGTFTDVTVIAGVGNALFSVGTGFADMDNDGNLDLYVVNFNSGPDVLYRNDGPTGPRDEYQFTDVTSGAGLTEQQSSRGMAFVDYDRDGLIDIYVDLGSHGLRLQHELLADRVRQPRNQGART